MAQVALIDAVALLTTIEENARKAKNAIRRFTDLRKGGIRQSIELELGDPNSLVQLSDEQIDGQQTLALDAIATIKASARNLP